MRIALVDESPLPGRLPKDVTELAAIGSARLVGERSVPLLLARDTALVGWAFHRQRFGPCTALPQDLVDANARSRGDWTIRNLWGNFILAWADRSGEIYLLRSPVTGPPLFQILDDHPPEACGQSAAGRRCAFTDLALARALGFRLDRLDPAIIDAQLRYPLLRAPCTGITGLREILPGEISRLGAREREPASWLPWTYAQHPPRRASSRELHDMVRGVVSAWSGRFAHIQLELSGGIDSSIVAACLAERDAPWQAVTMVTPEPDGDERIYSRPVAERMQVPLVELFHERAGDAADPLRPPRRLRARPGGFGLLGPDDDAFLAAARAFGAQAIFSGTGGDSIFGYQSSIAPALDALRFAGLGTGLEAARDQAAIMGDNLWNALRRAASGLVRGLRLWPVDDSLLSQRFAAARPEHPWTRNAMTVAPGQRAYGMKLLIIQPFLDGYDRAFVFPKIAPLLSQPLVEFGLGVQSWQWGEGGVNRALARQAFKDALPDIVLARRSKGRILSIFLPAFEANRARLRPYLLDGWLAGAGILDLDEIDALLAGRARADPLAMIRILHLTDIERWARSIVCGGTNQQGRNPSIPDVTRQATTSDVHPEARASARIVGPRPDRDLPRP